LESGCPQEKEEEIARLGRLNEVREDHRTRKDSEADKAKQLPS
jgi:hypothetical protein